AVALEVGRGARVGGTAAGARVRDRVRPHHWQPHPPRREVPALARGQGPEGLRAGAAPRLTEPRGPEAEPAQLRLGVSRWSFAPGVSAILDAKASPGITGGPQSFGAQPKLRGRQLRR